MRLFEEIVKLIKIYKILLCLMLFNNTFLIVTYEIIDLIYSSKASPTYNTEILILIFKIVFQIIMLSVLIYSIIKTKLIKVGFICTIM